MLSGIFKDHGGLLPCICQHPFRLLLCIQKHGVRSLAGRMFDLLCFFILLPDALDIQVCRGLGNLENIIELKRSLCNGACLGYPDLLGFQLLLRIGQLLFQRIDFLRLQDNQFQQLIPVQLFQFFFGFKLILASSLMMALPAGESP